MKTQNLLLLAIIGLGTWFMFNKKSNIAFPILNINWKTRTAIASYKGQEININFQHPIDINFQGYKIITDISLSTGLMLKIFDNAGKLLQTYKEIN